MASLGKDTLLEALEACRAGDWARAHRIVMKDERGEFACWTHALVHRQESDDSNAAYWYSRCERRMRKGLPVQEELEEIRAALG
jgi:hypothetical protein